MIGLTCPHCESALVIPDECRTAQVQCGSCQQLAPNPVRPPDPTPGVFVAQAIDQEVFKRRKKSAQRVGLAVLAAIGVLVASLIGAVATQSGVMLFVLFPLFFGIVAASIHWTQAAEPGLSWILGWFLLATFVILGGCGMCGAIGGLWDSARPLFGL